MKFLYFPFSTKNFHKYIGLFILGLLVGGVMTLVLHGQSYDNLYIQKKEVESYVIELQNTIERLEKIQQQQTHNLLVREILVQTDLSDPVKNVDIRTEVSGLLKDLIGENVETINPELIINIVDNRVIMVEEKQFRLNVRSLVISKTLILNLSTSELNQPNPIND